MLAPSSNRLAPQFHKQSLQYKMARLRRIVLGMALVAGLGALGWVSHYAWTTGRTAVEQAAVMNQGQQIVGAAKVLVAESLDQDPQLAELLAHGHLKTIPAGWEDGEHFRHAHKAGVPAQVCQKINEKAGLTGSKRVVEEVRNAELEQTADFGCLVESRTVFFKY